MIEQEKDVQFRFDSGEKSLSGKLAELGLPGYARFYSCIGLPNIFAWKNVEKTESFQETWLFVPDRTLEGILRCKRKFDITSEKHHPVTSSLQLDNQTLFPVHCYGKIAAFVVIPEGKQFSASPAELERLEKIDNSLGHGDKFDAVQIAFEFVSRLFDCKQSYSEFAQRLLNFLTDQVDKSYAGLYWKGADGYHRRWAYGDLQLSDKIPLDISAETIELWHEANSLGKSFIAAELVQDEPVFVQSPPSFLFVHQTPNFGDREQWLVMAVPGDISAAAMARITIIASLLSSMDDERTTGYSDLIEMFGGLLDKNHKALSLDEALKLCFKLIDGKLRLTSMCLLDTANSVIKCMRVGDDQLKIEKSNVSQIPNRATRVIESLEPAFNDGPAQPMQDARDGARDAAVSHVLFPVPIKESGAVLLSAEFAGGLERAKRFQHLFELTSKYLGVCISLTRAATGELKVVGTPANEIAETMALARLRTLSKLNGGYFHELIEYLSVILGQAEIMDYELQKTNRPLTVEHLHQSTDRIVRAAEFLARRLEELKEVSTIRAIDSGRSISSEQFLNMLPTMTFGYFLTVKDNKNVEIAVQTKPDKNVSFPIPVLHIYDFILPLILTIMDEAVCSGKMYIGVAEHFGRPVLRISYPKKLSGKLSLEKLLDKVFKYYQSQKGEEGQILVAADDAQFVFSDCDGDRFQAIYSCVGQHHPVEEYN